MPSPAVCCMTTTLLPCLVAAAATIRILISYSVILVPQPYASAKHSLLASPWAHSTQQTWRRRPVAMRKYRDLMRSC